MSTTGRNHPMTVGTSTIADSKSRIGREMCRRFDSRTTVCCQPTGAGAVPRVRRRWTQSQPVKSRSVKTATPENQMRRTMRTQRTSEWLGPLSAGRISLAIGSAVDCRAAAIAEGVGGFAWLRYRIRG